MVIGRFAFALLASVSLMAMGLIANIGPSLAFQDIVNRPIVDMVRREWLADHAVKAIEVDGHLVGVKGVTNGLQRQTRQALEQAGFTPLQATLAIAAALRVETADQARKAELRDAVARARYLHDRRQAEAQRARSWPLNVDAPEIAEPGDVVPPDQSEDEVDAYATGEDNDPVELVDRHGSRVRIQQGETVVYDGPAELSLSSTARTDGSGLDWLRRPLVGKLDVDNSSGQDVTA